jgi:hypothetical protein
MDTGIVTSYALYIVIGLISILFILFYPMLISTYATAYGGAAGIAGGELSIVSPSGPGAEGFGGLNPNHAHPLNEIRLIIIYISSLILLNTDSAKIS